MADQRPEVFISVSLFNDLNKVASACAKLGGQLLTGPMLSPKCSCLVVSQSSAGMSEKLMSALAIGIPIVSPAWIDLSLEAGHWLLDPASILTHDIGSCGLEGTSNYCSRPLSFRIRQTRHRSGGLFKGWRVMLFFERVPKMRAYYRILKLGGAELVKLHSGHASDLIQKMSAIPGVFTHLLSEPNMVDADFVHILKSNGLQVCKSLIVPHALLKCESKPNLDQFCLSLDILQRHHRCQKSILKRDDDAKEESKRMCPMISTSPTTPGSPSHGRLIGKSEHMGQNELKRASHLVYQFQLSQMLEFRPVVKFVRRLASSKMDTSAAIREIPWVFCAFFASSTRPDTELDSEDWLWALQSLRGCISTHRYPSLKVLRHIILDGILLQANEVVRSVSYDLVLSVAIFCHPPVSQQFRAYYLTLFDLDNVHCDQVERVDLWDNLAKLIAPQDPKDAPGSSLLLDLMLTVMEVDLSFWMESFISSEFALPKKWPILGHALWQAGHELGCVNSRCKTVLDKYCRALAEEEEDDEEGQQDNVALLRRLVHLMSLTICIMELPSKMNANKQIMAKYLASRFTEPDLCQKLERRLWFELNLLEPDWLVAFVVYHMLGKTQMLDQISLRHISQRLILPFDNVTEIPQQQPHASLTESSSDQKATSVRLNKYGETTLHVACRKGDVGRLRELMASKQSACMNMPDHLGWTPLHEAVGHGRVECVRILLDHPLPKVNVWLTDGQHGLNPFHEAVKLGHLQIVQMILDYLRRQGGDAMVQRMLNCRTQSGQRPDELAEDRGIRDVLQHAIPSTLCISMKKAHYWMLCSLLLSKYCASFRLHAIKQVMKNQDGPFNVSVAEMLPPSTTPRCPVSRSTLVEAEDIRTFWSMATPSVRWSQACINFIQSCQTSCFTSGAK